MTAMGGIFAIFVFIGITGAHSAAVSRSGSLQVDMRTCEEILKSEDLQLTSLNTLSFVELEGIIEILIRRVPVELEKRAELVMKSFGIEVAEDLDFAGSNRDFVHAFLAELAVSGRMQDRSPSGKTALVALIEFSAIRLSGISSLEVPEKGDLEEVRNLVRGRVPHVNYELDFFRDKSGRRLVDLVARFVPLHPQARYLNLIEVYGVNFASQIDCRGSASEFALYLLQNLEESKKLNAINKFGDPLIFGLFY